MLPVACQFTFSPQHLNLKGLTLRCQTEIIVLVEGENIVGEGMGLALRVRDTRKYAMESDLLELDARQ